MSTAVNEGPVSTHRIPLEQAAQDFADATANPPFLYDLGPEKGREVVNQTQAGEIAKPEVTDEWIKVPGGPDGDVSVRIVRPAGATGTLPVILYIHGAGWVFGNAGTHDRLVRELAVRAGAAAEFPEYSLSPEVKYPVALEECYAVARWLAEGAPGNRLDASRVAIAGDSVGGNMTAALAILAKQRGDITFAAQLPLYPLSTVSTLGAEEDELRGLPKALVINGECDVLRDEGENYARKLRAAGVDVTAARYAGTIHDFMMLNALADTNAAKAATAQAGAFLHDTLH